MQHEYSVLTTALPSLYLTTGEHLEHDRKWVRLPYNSLCDCDVCIFVVVTPYCTSFSTQVSPTVLSFWLIMYATWVFSSNDCLAFSLSHHWGTLGTWQEVSKATPRLLVWLWCVHICGCHILLYFLLHTGESECSFLLTHNVCNMSIQF